MNSLRGIIFCHVCENYQSFISQTQIQPGREHKKRRESVCLKCEYRHQFTDAINPVRGKKGKMRFIKYPSHTPRELLISQAQKLNMKRGGNSSTFQTFEAKKRY